jgi:hypothetical protein
VCDLEPIGDPSILRVINNDAVLVRRLVVHYESRKRELKKRLMNEGL